MANSPNPNPPKLVDWENFPKVKHKGSLWRKIKRRVKRYLMPICLVLAVGIAALVVFIANRDNTVSHNSESQVTISGDTMGTLWTVKIPNADLQNVHTTQKKVQTEISALLEKLNSEMSLWNSQSEVSRFNEYLKQDWYLVPAELADIANRAQVISEQTDGAFDIAIAPLVFLWGFGPANLNINAGWAPTEEQIARTKLPFGYKYLQVQTTPPGLRKLDQAVQIDLGGIAKGYAADKVAEFLDLMEIKNYLISMGGDLRAKGEGSEKGGWKIGIQIPMADSKRIFRQVLLRNQSLSTSGNYNNVLSLNGKNYSHIINPLTGMAMEASSSSVSVIANDSTTADALATAFVVLGKEKALELALRLKVEALFVWKGDKQFESAQTPGFPK